MPLTKETTDGIAEINREVAQRIRDRADTIACDLITGCSTLISRPGEPTTYMDSAYIELLGCYSVDKCERKKKEEIARKCA